MERYRNASLVILGLILFSCKGQEVQEYNERSRWTPLACGNFQVYMLDSVKTTFLKISLNTGLYELQKINEFELPHAILNLEKVVYDQDISSMPCNDVMPSIKPEIVTRELPRSGKINVFVDGDNLMLHEKGSAYRISIQLKNVQFKSLKTPISVTLENITVGWLPG